MDLDRHITWRINDHIIGRRWQSVRLPIERILPGESISAAIPGDGGQQVAIFQPFRMRATEMHSPLQARTTTLYPAL